MRLNKRGHLKRIFAFIMALLLVLQPSYRLGRNVFASEQITVVDSVVNDNYTVYFCASEIADDENFKANGVYLYAYNENSDGTKTVYSGQPVQMTASSAGDNIYEYQLDAGYTKVQFLLGSSVETATVQSEVYDLDWSQYTDSTLPCFTMQLVYNDEEEIEVSTTVDSVNLNTNTSTLSTDGEDVTPSEAEEGDESINGSSVTSGSIKETDDTETKETVSNVIVGTNAAISLATSTTSFTPSSGYIYLNPEGMTENGIDWTNTDIYLIVNTWSELQAGEKLANGYWRWKLQSSWKDTSHKFAFAAANSWDTIKSANYYRTELSDINLGDAANIGKVYVQDGTAIDSIDSKKVYAIKEFVSLENQPLYFMDYTAQYTSINAVFSDDYMFSDNTEVSVVATAKVNGDSNLFGIIIPSQQKYVKFVDDQGNQIGDIYNLYGGTETTVKSTLFASGTNDTYHYGITEKADGTKISNWGETPTANTSSLAGKTLYFDSSSFPITSGGSLQVGTADEVSFTDESTMFSYTFPENTDATHQTTLTFITDNVEYHFKWNDTSCNKVTLLSDGIAIVNDKYARATTVYYDATYSKLHYCDAGDYAIPKSGGNVYYYATGDNVNPVKGTMTKESKYSDGTNTWEDVYSIELSAGYDKISFSNFEMTSYNNYGAHGESTTTLDIPVGLTNPCFYADTSDSAIYATTDTTRDGYWAEVYTIRDAESGKNTDVVDIDREEFENESGTLYVNSTFYDYYTDYELNGSNRDTYGGDNSVSYRNWVTFRQFNQALSDYYSENKVSIPIYTGHFQPDLFDSYKFTDINASDLLLYGLNSKFYNYNNFFSTNNSNINISGSTVDTKSVAQGLVSDELNQGTLMMSTESGTVSEPHFDEAFLTGNNSKNAVLGEVYHNVSFPFVQKDVKNNGVKYWYFDSSETTLAMKQDTTTNAYYLEDVGKQSWSKNVNSSSVEQSAYGFFPFNETSTAVSAKTYNYGFGVKLEFTFRLTEDGYVLSSSGAKVPITFEFSGDDDVWVYIDNTLVLDVGGAHGVATGEINFANQKATATVDLVKSSAGSSTSGEDITKSFELSSDNTQEHTLTIYYMERGMWESNMKITFNFPDENQLEVEKQVDESNVNKMFQGLFDEKSLFTYKIMTQATHYGTKEVTDSADKVLPEIFNNTFSSETLSVASTSNTFEQTTDPVDKSNSVAHWYAKYNDSSGAYRYKRYGIIDYAGSEDSLDISNMDYLEFKLYYDYNDTPSLSNMYLQLVDSNGKIKGNISSGYLSGKTYGIPSMAKQKWITIRIDLSKLDEETGFNAKEVAQIKFGYNYPRDIYLDDFTFYPSSVASELVGFITKQYNIPDYGSATDGCLKIPEGAIYESTTGKTQTIGEDGTFVLQNKEVITFSDQFRRGSYIYLEEESNSLFSTSWSIYENDTLVKSFGTGTTVENGNVTSVSNVSGNIVNDDRTENVNTGTDEEGKYISTGNNYNGSQPSDKETFVFRSYSDPDNVATTTKLKVVFTNKVRVGSLIIEKEKLRASDNLTATYEFKVKFYNIGGIGLEDEAIETTVYVSAGNSVEIKGIPLGTFYEIEEVTPTDSSYLGNVEVSSSSSMTVDTNTNIVKGYITTETAEDVTPDTVTFYNTKEPKISVSVVKDWKTEVEGDTLKTPGSIYVQLQRRKSQSDDEEDLIYNAVENYECIKLEPSYEKDEESDTVQVLWKYTVSGLDLYVDYESSSGGLYSEINDPVWWYRFVEVDENGNPVENGTVITLQEGEYEVNNGEDATHDENWNYTSTITNKLLSTINLMVVKTAESKTEENKTIPLSGVTFKLEMYDATDQVYNEMTSENQQTTTGDDGTVTFANLENGKYRLTEVKTAWGYTLLKDAIIIDIERSSGTYTYHLENSSDTTSMKIEYVDGIPTIKLPIKNASNIELPSTGVKLPITVLAIGIILCLITIVLYRKDKKKCRKEGEAPDA